MSSQQLYTKTIFYHYLILVVDSQKQNARNNKYFTYSKKRNGNSKHKTTVADSKIAGT